MDKEILHEISVIWDKIQSIEKKLSDLTENRHAENSERIVSSEEALCDVDEAYNQRVADIEDALCEIAEIVDSE